MTNTVTYGSLTTVSGVVYDDQGRAVSQTDALGNTVETAYDSLGQVLALSGATYPVTYAYDTAGRMSALSTTRDEVTPDTTHWYYDGAAGLLTKQQKSAELKLQARSERDFERTEPHSAKRIIVSLSNAN